MIDLSVIDSEDANSLILDLFSIIDFTESMSSGRLTANLNVILLTIMGELAATKGFIAIGADGRDVSYLKTKGKLQKSVVRGLLSDIAPSDILTADEHTGLQAADIALVLPLRKKKTLGYLGVGGRMVHRRFKRKKDFYIKAFLNISCLVIENELLFHGQKDLNRKLNQKIFQLNTIFDISKDLNLLLEEKKVLDVIMRTIMGHFLISKAVIFTYSQAGIIWVRRGVKCNDSLCDLLQDTQSKTLMAQQAFVPLVDDHDLFRAFKSLDLTYFLPIFFQDSLMGGLFTGNKLSSQPFDAEDKEFLKTLLNQTAVEIQNIRLFEEYTSKKLLEKELSIARGIQERLLPKTIPTIPDFQIDVRIQQCNELGGDFFNVFPTHNGCYAVLVGDVSGKGIPAALIMSNLQALIKSIFSEPVDMRQGMARINRLLFESTELNRYSTLFLLLLDPKDHTFTYCNAGHNQPFVLNNAGTLQHLDKGGIPVGLFQSAAYETESKALAPDDMLVIYSDGITEAMDIHSEEFGQGRLETVCREHRQLPVTGVLDAVLHEIAAFKGAFKQNDDMTLFVLKREDRAN